MLEVNKISKAMDDRVLFSDLSFKIPRASIVGTVVTYNNQHQLIICFRCDWSKWQWKNYLI